MIIDYHSHIKWDRENNTFDVDGLLNDMEENDISIRVVSALNGPSIREQNNIVENLVNSYPDKLIGSAIINPKAIDCVDEMKRVCESGKFKCIELDSLEHNYYPEEISELDEIFKLANLYNIIVNVFTGWGPRTMPAQWAYYAKRHKDVKIVALHMGTTDFGYGTVDLIPKYENMYVETSCMYELPILKKAFAKIDNRKILFGSHYPHKLTCCSIETFDLLNLDKETKDNLYFKNAAHILGVKLDNKK